VAAAEGIELLTPLRSQLTWRVPILFLTQRDTEVDIITALNAGADDYMVKPARPGELLARIQALVRRTQPDPPQEEEQHYGPFTINKEKRTTAWLRGRKSTRLNSSHAKTSYAVFCWTKKTVAPARAQR